MKTTTKTKYLLILLTSAFVACNDWLDVSPRSEIRESALFASENGFKNALNGVYILIADENLYGKNASMYIPEALCRHWTLPADNENTLTRLSNFDYRYSATETLIANLWLHYYQAIAQLNNILTALDATGVKFEYGNRSLIRGEALGLRAFLHLDLLRFFGPAPDSSLNPAAVAIPYALEMTKDPNRLVSLPWSQVVANIESDLDSAASLLAEVDPLVAHGNIDLNRPRQEAGLPEDLWQFNRQSRFNYYAALACKARLYNWTGDKNRAAQFARAVIESGKFALCDKRYELTRNPATGNDANFEMLDEHIFGVHNPDLQSVVASLFKTSDAAFTQTQNNMNVALETSANPSDIRRQSRYWTFTQHADGRSVNHFLKYSGNERIAPNNVVPLLRLSEMYLILCESLPLAEAAPYFSAYRASRAMESSIDAPSTASESALFSRLEKEYRKEFFGEGQMFFFYKRHRFEKYSFPTVWTVPTGGYVVPKPKAQTAFE